MIVGCVWLPQYVSEKWHRKFKVMFWAHEYILLAPSTESIKFSHNMIIILLRIYCPCTSLNRFQLGGNCKLKEMGISYQISKLLLIHPRRIIGNILKVLKHYRLSHMSIGRDRRCPLVF